MSKHLANNGISDLMKRATLFGDFYESNVEEHPLHERLKDDWFNIADTLKDNELKIYFIIDRCVYTKNNEKEIEFDSGFYTKTYDLTFSKDVDQFFYRYSMRLMSLHTLILGDLLPFVAICLWKHHMLSYPLIELPLGLEFRLFDIRDRWKYLTNDFEILEKNIKYKSPLQTALIWYTLAKLSKTHLETFMNMYRCIEVLSAEFHQNTENKLHRFVKDELNMFDHVIKNKFRIPATQKVKSYLKSQYIESGKVEKILKFRNKIAHGEEYALEWNENLVCTIGEMEAIILTIINRKIKKMGIKDFKNPSFLNNYVLLIYKSKRKIVLIDMDEIECYPNDWNMSSALGRLTDEDELLESIQDHLKKEEIVNSQICKRLVENFGQIICY